MDENMEIEETPSSLPPHMQDNPEAVIDIQFNQELEPINDNFTEEPETHDVNDPKPGSLLLRGVDDLNTRIIKTYVDKIVKPDYTFAEKEKFSKFDYQIEWVNDSSLNLKFENPEGSMEAMELLTDKEKLDGREYNLIGDLEERPCIDLVKEDGDKAELYIRQSTWGDKKVKDSRAYSRYYLLHGEPERSERLPAARVRQETYREDYDNSPDLITGEQQETQGIFGYEGDRDVNSLNSKNEFRGNYRERDSYRRRGGRGKGKHMSEDKWSSDKFIDRERGYERRSGAYDYNGYNHNGRRNNRGKRDSNSNSNSNSNRNTGYRDDEDDLFPDFFKNKEGESNAPGETQGENVLRDRSRSPSRIVEE